MAKLTGLLDGIAWFGYTRVIRLYDFECFIEESNEAYLSAKSPQEGEDARLPQAHEHGGRTQGHWGPQASGPQAPGRLTFAPE
jgi:hypothetical protein